MPFPRIPSNPYVSKRAVGLATRHAGGVVSTFTFMAIALALTTVFFAVVFAFSHGAAGASAPPAQVTTFPQGSDGLQVVRADPVPLSRVLAFLSVPGRIALNGPASAGVPVPLQGAPIAASGDLLAGDSLRVCTDLPVPRVELRLVDGATGQPLGTHTFVAPPVCYLA
ncbi:MAG TPA: hypothetical protein VM286_07075 [Candidatus Thermoplasmatota archaeon]|nr:hypothetical protein [Candidatus Thermoplasmatota archaeon]